MNFLPRENLGGIFEVKIFIVCEVEHFYFILSRDIKGKPEQILEEIQYRKNKRILKRTPNHLGNPWHDGDMEDKKNKNGGDTKVKEHDGERLWSVGLMTLYASQLLITMSRNYSHALINNESKRNTTC